MANAKLKRSLDLGNIDGLAREQVSTSTQQQHNATTQEQAERQNDAHTQQRSNARTIVKSPKRGGQTYYLEERHLEALRHIKAFDNYDKQDIVRTAVDQFIRQYTNNTDGAYKLTDTGKMLVDEYVKSM